MKNKLRPILLFIAALLCSSITQAVTASQVVTSPTFADTNSKKKVTPKASSHLSSHNKLKKRVAQWGIGGVVVLFCMYGVYRMVKHSSSDKHDSSGEDDRDDHDIDENHVLTMEELYNMTPDYMIDPHPIDNLKASLSNEEDRQKIDSIIKDMQETKGNTNILPYMVAIQPLSNIMQNNNIDDRKKIVDFYAHFIEEGFENRGDTRRGEHLLSQLQDLQEPLTENFLASLLLKKSEATDSIYAKSLGKIILFFFKVEPDRCLTMLIALMHHEEDDIRERIISSLGRSYLDTAIPNTPLLPLLQQAMEDNNPQIKKAAINSIGLLAVQNDKIIAILLEEAKTSNNIDVQHASIKALGSLAVVDAIPLLLGILRENHERRIRNAAVKAITKLANKQLIPIQYLYDLIPITENEEDPYIQERLKRVLDKVQGMDMDEII